MKIDAFNLGLDINTHTLTFRILPSLWKNFNQANMILPTLKDWKEIKFLNEDGVDFNDEINVLPNNHGGVYVFIIKSDIFPGISEYFAYIGRAKLTDNHNLRVRLRSYLTKYNNENERPKVSRMINQYGPSLYLRYIEIDNNDVIDYLESELINSLLPPFNDEIPNKIIRDAVQAF